MDQARPLDTHVFIRAYGSRCGGRRVIVGNACAGVPTGRGPRTSLTIDRARRKPAQPIPTGRVLGVGVAVTADAPAASIVNMAARPALLEYSEDEPHLRSHTPEIKLAGVSKHLFGTIYTKRCCRMTRNMRQSGAKMETPRSRKFIGMLLILVLSASLTSAARAASPNPHTFCGTRLSAPHEMGVTNNSGYPVRLVNVGPGCEEFPLGNIAPGETLVVLSLTTIMMADKSGAGWCYLGFNEGEHWNYTLTSDGAWTAVSRAKPPVVSPSVANPIPVTDTLPTVAKRPQTFVAMGDSYSSGEGNPDFDPETNAGSDQCHRSPKSWARRISYYQTSTIHIACSGATLDDILKNGRSTEAAQLKRLKEISQTNDVRLVTFSVGGNDLGFSHVLKGCFLKNFTKLHNDCQDDVNVQFDRMPEVARRIKDDLVPAIRLAAPNARIVQVGYPKLFGPNSTKCAWLSRTERNALQTDFSFLDTLSIRNARDGGYEFVSLQQTFNDHELCTANSWIYPIASFGNNAVTNVNQGHPIDKGQREMARVVQSRL